MKIKLDEYVPRTLARILADIGHDVDTVPDEGLSGKDDIVVWQAAQKAADF